MRPIDKIVVHSSASPEGVELSAGAIREMHKRDRGWNDIGYHYVIELSGKVVPGRQESVPGAGVRGHNAHSIHICYVGGVGKDGRAKDTRTKEQKGALYRLIVDLLARYPGAELCGHRDLAPTACPSFDVKKDWQTHWQEAIEEEERRASLIE